MFSRIAALGLLASFLGLSLPVQAQNCVPIPLVGKPQTNEVTKTVAQPTLPGPFGVKITRNNWNTDWAVSSNADFSRYVATITARDGGTFDIRLFLKYSDQTEDEYFNNREQRLVAGETLTIEARPRSAQDQPFHVNLFVNGIPALGRTYTASVVGCR
jgi:hypothetical protein